MSGKLFIISAPSGTGKSTLLNLVISRVKRLAFSISHTTRSPRAGEREAQEYFFVNSETFEQMIDAGAFLEWAKVHTNYYGTALAPLNEQLSRDCDVVLDIDVQGAEIIRTDSRIPAVHIFIAPPDMAELERRLRGRESESEQALQVRMKNAHEEMKQSSSYDYFIVNDDLHQAAELLISIIYAERSRDRRNPDGASIELINIKR